MQQEQEQGRTEPATPFKLSEAKKRGQVAKSLDFNSMVVVGGLLIALTVWGEAQWERLCELCRRLFVNSAALDFEQGAFLSTASLISYEALSLVLPAALAGSAFAIIANIVQTGPLISLEPLKPKFERINPVAGFKRVFNKRMLFEALKSVLKLAVFAAVAYGFFSAAWASLTSIYVNDAPSQTQRFAEGAVDLLLRLGLALVVIGLLDLAYARWSYSRQMMMSRRELKEEIKRREGDPLIRAKIRELQRENLKQARSMSRVPDADVLITNPQHLAIALRYDRTRTSAPIIIAKGADAWAAEMRGLALRHGVPRFENRRLARLLFQRGEIDQQIPPESYVDVARVYADMNERRAQARYEVAR